MIFDVVYHHASTSHNHYWQYDGNTIDEGGIYFEDPFHYEPARDENGRSFAHWKSEVQNFLLDHARMMLDEYRGDGLRFDMAHSLTWECTGENAIDELKSFIGWMGFDRSWNFIRYLQ